MKNVLIAAAFALASILPAQADMITRTSENSVSVTIDRLAAAVEKAGAKVFARIDHAKGAASINQDLRPTQMIMFGRPEMGTPIMLTSQSMALDLPQRVLAWQTEDGSVMIGYHDPADVAAAHGVPADHPTIAMMQGALKKVTGFAAGK